MFVFFSETEQILSDAKKNTFCRNEKNPCGSETIPQKRQKKPETDKMPSRSGKNPGNGKNTFSKRKNPQPEENMFASTLGNAMSKEKYFALGNIAKILEKDPA